MSHRLHLIAFRFFSAVLFGFAMSCGIANAELVGTDEATASLEPADREKLRATADIKITNQDGTLVAVATHLLKWVRN